MSQANINIIQHTYQDLMAIDCLCLHHITIANKLMTLQSTTYVCSCLSSAVVYMERCNELYNEIHNANRINLLVPYRSLYLYYIINIIFPAVLT